MLIKSVLFVFFNFSHASAQIIDVHMHVYRQSPQLIEKILSDMNQGGIEQTFIYSWGYMAGQDENTAKAENDFVAATVRKYPGKFVGFCGVPIMAPWSPREVDRCAKMGLPGVKIHPVANRVDFSKPEVLKSMDLIFKAMNQYGMILTVDSAFFNTMATFRFLQLARNYLNVNVILAHAFYHHYREIEMIIDFYNVDPAKPRNLWVDVSFVVEKYIDHLQRDPWMWYLRRINDRVLFGSDGPKRQVLDIIKIFNRYPWTAQEREMIFFKNAGSLIKSTLQIRRKIKTGKK
jgi:predicted TIM-barrel fold metal-dependent hydrolase